MNTLKLIENYETQALELGALDVAVKLNWLRNAVLTQDANTDDIIERLLQIAILNK